MSSLVQKHFAAQPSSLLGPTHALIKNYEAYFVFRALGPLSGLRVLDLGAGSGYYSELALKRGAREVHAVDFCPHFFKSNAKIQWQKLDLQSELFHGQTSDVILALGVLEFLENPESFLRTCRDQLQPQARLVLLYPPTNWASRLYTRYHARHGLKIRSFDPGQVRSTLKPLRLTKHIRLHPYAQLDVYAH